MNTPQTVPDLVELVRKNLDERIDYMQTQVDELRVLRAQVESFDDAGNGEPATPEHLKPPPTFAGQQGFRKSRTGWNLCPTCLGISPEHQPGCHLHK